MIRPKDCSRGKANNSGEVTVKRSCSGFGSSHSTMCHLQKNKNSIGIENSLSHTCSKKFQNSNILDTEPRKLDSLMQGTAIITDLSMTSANPDQTTPSGSSNFSTVLAFDSSKMPPNVQQTKTASVESGSNMMARSKSMKLDKREKRSNFSTGESRLKKQSQNGIFKSFDDLAAVMFQESVPFKKTSSLLRQQTTIVPPRKQNTIGDRGSVLQDSPKSIYMDNMSPKTNKEKMKRRAGFTNANKSRIDKGQIDLEMIVSAKSKASTIGKVYKRNERKRKHSENEYSGEGDNDTNHYRNNVVLKGRNRKLGRSKTVLGPDPMGDDYDIPAYHRISKGVPKPRWTISIADPDGDVFEVKSNIHPQQDLKDITSVCTTKTNYHR